MNYTKTTLIFKSKTKPPYLIGSQIRGAFGYALKKVTCINPSFQCEGCFAANNCLYHEFYEAKNSFHKYRFDFEVGKEFYDFSLYLFDTAVEKLPYVISALHMMLTKNGLGKERIVVKEFDLYVNDKSAFQNGQITLPKKFIETFEAPVKKQNITLNLKTPLRIKKNNQFVRDESLELKDIVNSIYQRQMQLLNKGYKKFPYPIKGTIVQKKLWYNLV